MNAILLGTIVFTVLILLLSLIILQMRTWLVPNKVVSLTINQQKPFDVKSGRKLLEVLNDADIPVPSACAGAGTCGLCKVTVISGGGKPLITEESRLTIKDRREHLRLSCQVVVRDDMAVEIPSQILHADAWQSRVQSVRNLSPLMREIVLAMPQGKQLDFKPGAYVQVTSSPFDLTFSNFTIDEAHQDIWQRLGVSSLRVKSRERVTRAYSLANRPSEQDYIVLLVRLALPPPAQQRSVPPGIVSSWLFSLSVGDVVDVGGPFGEFGLKDNDREMVLIGGGVGMAPLRSIIHHELQSDRDRPVSFFYGARSQNDLFYLQEFDELQRRHDRFKWVVALSDPQTNKNWDGPTGFIHEVYKRQHLDSHPHPERCDFYLCGPPLMQKAVISVLEDAGVDMAHIYADVFGE